MIDFTTDRPASDQSPDHEQEVARRQQLPYLLERLGEIAPDIPDDDLREDIHQWRALAMRVPTDPEDHIQGRLAELDTTYPMYRERGQDNAQCFPDDCLDNCEHARQQACPMLRDYDTIQRRERINERTDDPEEYQSEMLKLASDVGCHVVQTAASTVDEYHAPIVRYGQLLLAQAEEDVYNASHSDTITDELAAMSLAELANDADIDLPSTEDVDEMDAPDPGDDPEVSAG